MAYNAASKDILTQKYAAPPAPLGVPVKYKGAKFVCVLSKDTITLGMCVAFKAGVDPALYQVTRHDKTSTTTCGLAMGFACASNVTGEYFFVQVAGPEVDVSPTLITDTNIAANQMIVPDSATDGSVRPGTLGTDDHLRMGNAVDADSGANLNNYILFDRFSL